MPLPPPFMGLVLVGGLSSRGKAGITADTSCKDYFSFDSQRRYDAAVRLSAELRSPGQPDVGAQLGLQLRSRPDTPSPDTEPDPDTEMIRQPVPISAASDMATPIPTASFQAVAVDPAQATGPFLLTRDESTLESRSQNRADGASGTSFFDPAVDAVSNGRHPDRFMESSEEQQ